MLDNPDKGRVSAIGCLLGQLKRGNGGLSARTMSDRHCPTPDKGGRRSPEQVHAAAVLAPPQRSFRFDCQAAAAVGDREMEV
jgi:hypothetical protein